MSEIFKTRIKIPEKLLTKEKISGNQLLQLAHNERVIDVGVYLGPVRSTYLLKDIFGNEYILRMPGSRLELSEEKFVLRAKQITDINHLDLLTKIEWDNHPREHQNVEGDELNQLWKNQFRYIEEKPDDDQFGLRIPQIGAIHSSIAHWTTSDDPALVVMPTGTGKTEVMMSVFTAGGCKKVLIIVPSSSLREQIFNKFSFLGCLPDIGVLPFDTPLPKITRIDSGMQDAQDAQVLATSADILVATPNVLSKFSPEALSAITEPCTHLFVDEAHHNPAKTWSDVIEKFKDKKVLQFTATPFRNDGKRVSGNIVYNYPLGLAQKNGYFKKIEIIKVNELDDTVSDRLIAETAVNKLRSDITDRNLDHLLMARTNKVARVTDLLAIYNELAPDYNPIIITNDLGKNKQKEAIEKLQSRESRIIICVDMLGEGFDLPNLKVAAIHDLHKSLPITMQFIGRFTRISTDPIGDASAIFNIAEPKVGKKLESLYSEDPDWNEILRQHSEDSIDREIEMQEVINNFNGSLFEQISLWNLRPSFSTLIYKTSCENWNTTDIESMLPKTAHHWHAINEHEKIFIAVTSREDEVKWGKYRGIKNHSFELCVAYWDSESQALFIQCSNYNAFNPAAIAEKLCGETAEIHNGLRLFSVFDGVNLPMVKNLGASRAGHISYTMYFGPEVMIGLSSIDKAAATPNNIFGWGYEDGEIVTYGCSARSGKVWSRGGGTILDWRDWCSEVISKIPDEDTTEAEVIDGFLRPQPLNGRHNAVAITAEWGENIIKGDESRVSVFFGNEEKKLFEASVSTVGFSDSDPVDIVIQSGETRSVYRHTYRENPDPDAESGGFTVSRTEGPEVFLKKPSGIKTTLTDYIKKDPFVIRYVDGSFSYGNYHVVTPLPGTAYDRDSIQAVDLGVDIKKESQGKDVDQDTIQYATSQHFIEDYDVLFNDDGTGEVADIVALRKNDAEETITVHLIHCKYSHTENSGADMSNLYEVCGQAQKSVHWKHHGVSALVDRLKKRETVWKRDNYTRFIKGDADDLNKMKKLSRMYKIDFKVTIVQPGLSKSRASDNNMQIIGSTENYIVKTTDGDLNILASE